MLIARCFTQGMFSLAIASSTLTPFSRPRAFWVAALALHFAGMTLYAAAVFNPNAFLLVISGLPISCGFSLQLLSLRRFGQKHTPLWVLVSPPLLCVAALALPFVDTPVLFAAVHAVFAVQGAWIAGSVFTLPATHARLGARGQLMCGASLSACSSVLMSLSMFDVTDGHPVEQVSLITASLGFILLNMGWLTSQKDRAELELSRRVDIDHLTQVLNRSGLSKHSAPLIAEARRADRFVGLLLIDLDHFKHINDRWGHGVGDEVLFGVASALLRAVGSAGLCARLGGEEFVLLLTAPDLSAAMDLCARVQASVAEVHLPDATPVRFSGGLVAVNGASLSEKNLADADAAMYVAKSNGRNRIESAGLGPQRVAA